MQSESASQPHMFGIPPIGAQSWPLLLVTQWVSESHSTQPWNESAHLSLPAMPVQSAS